MEDGINRIDKTDRISKPLVLLTLVAFIILLLLTIAHGPKGNTGGFTPSCSLLKKGSMMYDKLIASGQLDTLYPLVDLSRSKIDYLLPALLS